MEKNFWRKYFKVYDNLNDIYPYNELVEKFVSEANPRESDIVLDAGCGTGNIAIPLSNKSGKVVAIDYMPEAVDIFNTKNETIEKKIVDISGGLPFEENKFNIIVCNNVLYSIPLEKRQKVIDDFYRVLKKEGKLIISNPEKRAKPHKIYLQHLNSTTKEKGWVHTIIDLILKMPDIIKLFYYNLLIQRKIGRKESFVSKKTQEEQLKIAGFKNVKSHNVYAGQAVMSVGFK